MDCVLYQEGQNNGVPDPTSGEVQSESAFSLSGLFPVHSFPIH